MFIQFVLLLSFLAVGFSAVAAIKTSSDRKSPLECPLKQAGKKAARCVTSKKTSKPAAKPKSSPVSLTPMESNFARPGLPVGPVATPLSTQAAPATQPDPQAQVPPGLTNYGRAPEPTGLNKWINSEPVTIASLKGRVAMVHFWTLGCSNCINVLPYVTKWYDTYRDKGFVILGIHTPEFAYEREAENVANAIKKFGINFPVAQDNDFATWNAYGNRYWPAIYLIDQTGNVVYIHYGEGKYQETENLIEYLLNKQ